MALESETFRVFVLRNNAEDAALEEGLPYVDVAPKTSLKKFLKMGGKKLGIKATKAFVPTGAGCNEIAFMDEMKMNDRVVFSEGEAYYDEDATAKSNEQEINISVLGAGGVGKSALTLRFVREFFVQDWEPTIEDAYRKVVDVDDRPCTLSVLDTAGQEDFESLRHQWLMDKDAIIFVYAINSRQSLDELDAFYQLYRHIHGESKKVPIILVANKKDLANLDPKQREVTTFQGQVKAQEYGGATHIEASAATGENVTFVFESLVRAVRTAKTKEKKALPSKCNIL